MSRQVVPTRVVVLAGGDGTRLQPLTRALYGRDVPKQFAVLSGHRSLLQQTIERATQLAPLDRILVVASARHEELAREQLRDHPGVDLVIQPRNLDTGPGLLLPLARIRAKDPGARVVFLPSDHYVADAAPLIAALKAAAAGPMRDRVTLLGVLPDDAEPDYGWILRGRRLSRLARHNGFAVRRFQEKPGAPLAEQLRSRGALWNTFISAGPVKTFWNLARKHLPKHARALERYTKQLGTPGEGRALLDAYAAMTPANFSSELLSRARDLAVVPVGGTGWCDWGSPKRVFQSLQGTPELDRLLDRLRTSVAELALAS